jgi:hypothetical protein
MGYFGANGVLTQTKVVKLGAFGVVIGRLSAAQEDECDAILQDGRPMETKIVNRDGVASQETTMTQQFVNYRNAIVRRGIRSWDLTDEAGAIAPIDDAHVAMLDGVDRNVLFLAVKAFNAPLDEKTQGNSAAGPTASSKG